MLTILGTLLSGVLSGGATGLLGVLVQRFFDSKAKSQDLELVRLNNQNAIDLRELELKQLDKQIAGNIQVATVQGQALVEQAEAQERSATVTADDALMTSSIAADRATYLSPLAQEKAPWAAFMMGMVDWVRGMTRPVLTTYLIVITHLMFNWVRELAAKNPQVVMTSSDLKEIIMTVITTLLYLATVATVWWFGTRPTKQPQAK